MTRKRWLVVGLVLVVGVVVGVGLVQAPSAERSQRRSLPEQQRAVQGAPAPLARLHDQASRLLPGGVVGLRHELAALRGFPVVVNLWASWCPPCRAEGPLFQQVSSEFGRRVAFVGVDSNDADGPARALLRSIPVSYPSFTNPREHEADRLGLAGLPATVFYDRRGHQVGIHQGQFLAVADLRAALERLL